MGGMDKKKTVHVDDALRTFARGFHEAIFGSPPAAREEKCKHDWEDIPSNVNPIILNGVCNANSFGATMWRGFPRIGGVESDRICLKCGKVDREYSEIVMGLYRTMLNKMERKERALQMIGEVERNG